MAETFFKVTIVGFIPVQIEVLMNEESSGKAASGAWALVHGDPSQYRWRLPSGRELYVKEGVPDRDSLKLISCVADTE